MTLVDLVARELERGTGSADAIAARIGADKGLVEMALDALTERGAIAGPCITCVPMPGSRSCATCIFSQ